MSNTPAKEKHPAFSKQRFLPDFIGFHLSSSYAFIVVGAVFVGEIKSPEGRTPTRGKARQPPSDRINETRRRLIRRISRFPINDRHFRYSNFKRSFITDVCLLFIDNCYLLVSHYVVTRVYAIKTRRKSSFVMFFFMFFVGSFAPFPWITHAK